MIGLITDAQGATSPVAVDDDRDEAGIAARARMATMCRVIIRRSLSKPSVFASSNIVIAGEAA